MSVDTSSRRKNMFTSTLVEFIWISFPTFFMSTFRSCAGVVAPVREQNADVILDSLSTDVATFSLADLGALQEYTKVS